LSSKSTGEIKDRYKRQLDLLGQPGQSCLENSSVAIVGLGGLGSPAATYLALAGVGKLVITDHDEVSPSNLNRQFLHWESDLDRTKWSSAEEKLNRLNSEVTVEIIEGKLSSSNIGDLPEVDAIVGSVDNFETRYLLNECAVNREVPYIHGAVEGFRAQLTTVIPGETPCLECFFPDKPPERAGIPIIGTTAGLAGTIMANETIKYLTDVGQLITGRLLVIDLSTNDFDSIRIQKNPTCPTCGR